MRQTLPDAMPPARRVNSPKPRVRPCAYFGCPTSIHLEQALCSKHWGRLPDDIQIRVLMEWDRNNSLEHQTQLWHDLVAAACDFLAAWSRVHG